MKSLNKIFTAVIVIIILNFICINIFFNSAYDDGQNRSYRVEIGRIALQIEKVGLKNINLSEYDYVTNIEPYNNDSKAFFENTDSDYLIREINGNTYRFDYTFNFASKRNSLVIAVNIALGVMCILILCIMIFIYFNILKPFKILCDVPYELSRGNLTVPLKEHKSRFFGKFIWGINLLRENMERQKQRELSLQRDKKTLLLSISHDIKTPLSAIKLYSKALSKGLYTDKNKQIEIAGNINNKADEIEEFVSQIIKASSDDFLNLEVKQDEFYLSELMNKISDYYKEKLELISIDFSVDEYSDCILYGDIDRSIEVLQNITENAVKYGDGHSIEILFSEEDDCRLVTIKNSGCTLPDTELPHIFESFWRGSNSGSSQGSGLGLYICRQLMRKMNGEIFAEIKGEFMYITSVFVKAG